MPLPERFGGPEGKSLARLTQGVDGLLVGLGVEGRPVHG